MLFTTLLRAVHRTNILFWTLLSKGIIIFPLRKQSENPWVYIPTNQDLLLLSCMCFMAAETLLVYEEIFVIWCSIATNPFKGVDLFVLISFHNIVFNKVTEPLYQQ